MKAILKFNLPDDQMEYDQANAASSLCSFIWDFDNYMRAVSRGKTDPDRSEEPLPLKLSIRQRIRAIFTGNITLPAYPRDEICERWFGEKWDNHIIIDELWK